MKLINKLLKGKTLIVRGKDHISKYVIDSIYRDGMFIFIRDAKGGTFEYHEKFGMPLIMDGYVRYNSNFIIDVEIVI
jgi:hypothetical protein